jgi:hypothetical protein
MIDDALIPRVNEESLTRFQRMLGDIRTQATEYACVGLEDYQAGDRAVGRIRELSQMFVELFKKSKAAASKAHKDICAEEKSYLDPLEQAKRDIGARMLAWKATEDKRKADERRLLEAAELKRAEDARLAQAVALSEHAQRVGNEALKHEAVALLDQPLDIAPVQQSRTVPSGGFTKVVGRQIVEVTNLRILLAAIGATLISDDPDCDPDLRRLLHPYYVRLTGDVCADPKRVEKLSDAVATWLRVEYQARGESFKVPGVKAYRKEGLG